MFRRRGFSPSDSTPKHVSSNECRRDVERKAKALEVANRIQPSVARHLRHQRQLEGKPFIEPNVHDIAERLHTNHKEWLDTKIAEDKAQESTMAKTSSQGGEPEPVAFKAGPRHVAEAVWGYENQQRSRQAVSGKHIEHEKQIAELEDITHHRKHTGSLEKNNGRKSPNEDSSQENGLRASGKPKHEPKRASEKVREFPRFTDSSPVEKESNAKKYEPEARGAKESAESIRRIGSIEDVDKALERHPHLRNYASFRKSYDYAAAYFDIMERRNSEELCEKGSKELYKQLSEEYRIPFTTIQQWYTDRYQPKLIKKLAKLDDEDSRHRRTMERFEKSFRESQIVGPVNAHHDMACVDIGETNGSISAEDIDKALKKFPELKQDSRFSEQYRRSLTYIEIMRRRQRGELPQVGNEDLYRKLADEYDISVSSVKNYYSGRYKPRLISKIEKLTGQIGKDTRRDSSAQVRDVSSQAFTLPHGNEIAKQLPAGENFTLEEVCRLIASMVRVNPELESTGVHQVDFSRFPRYLESVKASCEKIEQLVNDQIEFPENSSKYLKVATLGDRLYLRVRDSSRNNWLNAHAHHHFHFRTYEAKREIVESGRHSLAIENNNQLSKLIRQMSDYTGRINPKTGENSDLKPNLPYLNGESLHFLLDSVGMTLKDIKNQISKVSGTGQVSGCIANPKFPEVDNLRAMMGAIMNSDGSISDGGASYYERDRRRLERVEHHFRRFGDVDIWKSDDATRATQLRFPKVLADVFRFWGFLQGDKSIDNRGLPEEIRLGSFEVCRNYTEQLFPEDGNFANSTASWSRTIELADNQRKVRKFLLKYGRRKVTRVQGDKRNYVTRSLSWGRIDQMMKDSRTSYSSGARVLYDKVLGNPCRLIEDEKQVVERLGVGIVLRPAQVKYSLKSDRVSVEWTARVASVKDMIRLALLAPPDHPRKLDSVVRWMAGRPRKVAQIMDNLKHERLAARPEWDAFFN